MADDADDIARRLEKAIQHRLNGEYDDAVPILQSIIDESPDLADAHHELGLIYSFRVLMDESIAELERAVELSPGTVKYLLDLGKTHTMYGDYEKAIPVFEQVLSLEPFNDEATKNLSFIR